MKWSKTEREGRAHCSCCCVGPSVVLNDLEHVEWLRAFSVRSSPSAVKRVTVVEFKCGVAWRGGHQDGTNCETEQRLPLPCHRARHVRREYSEQFVTV